MASRFNSFWIAGLVSIILKEACAEDHLILRKPPAYWGSDRQSSIGHLEKGLDDATKYNWQIVDMKNDWKKIYAFEK
jgi:hypothetical protein